MCLPKLVCLVCAYHVYMWHIYITMLIHTVSNLKENVYWKMCMCIEYTTPTSNLLPPSLVIPGNTVTSSEIHTLLEYSQEFTSNLVMGFSMTNTTFEFGEVLLIVHYLKINILTLDYLFIHAGIYFDWH